MKSLILKGVFPCPYDDGVPDAPCEIRVFSADRAEKYRFGVYFLSTQEEVYEQVADWFGVEGVAKLEAFLEG